MKRRGFLGLIGGAAVAGPSMVKQAAASTMADLHLGQIGVGMIGGTDPAPTSIQGVMMSPQDWARQRLDKFNMLIKSKEFLERKKRETGVHMLDPDIAYYRSFSLSAKMRLQQERNFERWLREQPSWLERQINGDEFDY